MLDAQSSNGATLSLYTLSKPSISITLLGINRIVGVLLDKAWYILTYCSHHYHVRETSCPSKITPSFHWIVHLKLSKYSNENQKFLGLKNQRFQSFRFAPISQKVFIIARFDISMKAVVKKVFSSCSPWTWWLGSEFLTVLPTLFWARNWNSVFQILNLLNNFFTRY